MPTAKQITVSEQLKNIPTATRPTVRAARRAVRAVAPKAAEVAYQSRQPTSKSAMWKIARYDDAEGANVVGIGTFATYVALFFYRGRELDDARGLLQGGGKSRFIRLRTPADAERPAVRRLLRQAFSL
jgi:hypothetical protein